MRMSFLVLLLILSAAPSYSEGGAAQLVGLKEPVDVLACGMCADGGSTKGTLCDATGVEYHFFIDYGLVSTTRGRWYVGADYNTKNAELLDPEDPRIPAIQAILRDWLDRVASPEDQERLRALDWPVPAPSEPREQRLQNEAKWFVAHMMGKLH